MRDHDLSTTHALMNPQVDRSQAEAEQADGQVALHKVGRDATARSSCAARGCSPRSRRSPTSCSSTRARTSARRTAATRWRSRIPIATPGLQFICRDSYSQARDPYDYPLSSRFDEMDAVVIFDDVEIPQERVFLDGDTEGYCEVITDTGWRGHIMHQAFTRAWVKL